MPLPDGAYTDTHDGRVTLRILGEDGKYHKKVIGYLTESTKGEERMVPNRFFKETFPKQFLEAYPDEKVPFHEMSIGMYAATFGVCTSQGLYEILNEVYGPIHANSILDYCMFSIKHMSNATLLYKNTMEREVLFSEKVYSDSWYSDFFAKKLNEDKHHLFRIKWVQNLVKKGMKKVWLCVDGSNNDCMARQSFLSKFGFPKSHNKNKRIVGYMYAVDSETGIPVTYYVYEGNVPDSQAFQIIAAFLGGFKIEIEGVILDRGFAVESVFEAIDAHGWGYIIMLPGDLKGYSEMMKDHSEKIRWKSEYLIDDEAIFGAADVKKLFGTHDRISNICLFFDGANGSIHSNKLIRQIQAAKKKAEKAIANGSKASIKKQFQKYLRIEGVGSERKVIADYAKWDEEMEGKGFFAMATSEGINPSRCYKLYQTRDASETQYSILKTQEGAHVSRVHRTEGIYSKFFVAFLASIIRHILQIECKDLELDTNAMIQSLERIALLYTAENRYEAIRNLDTNQENLLARVSISEDDVVRLANEFNSRNKSGVKNPVRRITKDSPVVIKNTGKVGRPPTKKEESENSKPLDRETKSKGGRPKGKKDSQPRKPRSDKGVKRGPRVVKI